VLALLMLLVGCGAAPEAAPVATTTPSVPPPTKDPEPARLTALVWGLEHQGRAARRLRDHPAVEAATPVGRGVVLLRKRPGWAIPLDVLVVDPERYARTISEPFERLGPGTAILSTTSAGLRDAEVGDRLRLAGGRSLRVVGIVSDAALRDAELAMADGDRRVDPLRSTVVVTLREPVSPEELARTAERGAAARIYDGPGADGPARPLKLKVEFGEPAVGLPYGDDWIRLDPRWVRRNIVTRSVPILGGVTCHREMIPPLRRALGDLRRRGLSRLVNPGDYAGCYAPRRIQARGQLSLHAWGVAIDLNASANPFMGRSRQDRRLVRAMERQGFTWGGDWPTRPDPMHFELRP
jgi:D-alanyl-D-alanine carboxypeptidase